MPTVPTYQELVNRGSEHTWMTKEIVRVIADALASMPPTKYVGDSGVIELIHPEDGYNIGWLYIQPDIDEWAFTFTESNDKTIDTPAEKR